MNMKNNAYPIKLVSPNWLIDVDTNSNLVHTFATALRGINWETTSGQNFAKLDAIPNTESVRFFILKLNPEKKIRCRFSFFTIN